MTLSSYLSHLSITLAHINPYIKTRYGATTTAAAHPCLHHTPAAKVSTPAGLCHATEPPVL